MMHHMLDKLQALQLEPQHIGQVYDFDHMQEAIHLFQRGKTVGKVVVQVNPV